VTSVSCRPRKLLTHSCGRSLRTGHSEEMSRASRGQAEAEAMEPALRHSSATLRDNALSAYCSGSYEMLADIWFQHTSIRQPASWVRPCQTECFTFIFVGCLTTLSAPQSTLRRVIKELKRMWKETTPMSFMALSCYLSKATDEKREEKKPQSGQSVVRSRFEPITCSIHFRSITASVNLLGIRRGADKSLAFPICNTTRRIFLE
jgi:hypothetical protein